MAVSTASEPELQKNTRFRSLGVRPAIRSARANETGFARKKWGVKSMVLS